MVFQLLNRDNQFFTEDNLWKILNFFVDKIINYYYFYFTYFYYYFINITITINNELQNVHPSLDINIEKNTLTLATETEIKTLIVKSKSTASDLNPFPTRSLKDCIDVIIEPITIIINKYPQEGVFPDLFKKAYIRPLLKKISFIWKILEKMVAPRLLFHMAANSISNNLQSA